MDQEDLLNATSCAYQWIEHVKPKIDDFVVITIWFAEVARRVLHVGCPDGEFHVRSKNENGYRNAEIQDKALSIWRKGFIPLEIIKGDRGYFFGITKDSIRSNIRMAPIYMDD